jgi:hypothetical protein
MVDRSDWSRRAQHGRLDGARGFAPYPALIHQWCCWGPRLEPVAQRRFDNLWPRNLALVFSRYDEFSKMWGVDRARDTGSEAASSA